VVLIKLTLHVQLPTYHLPSSIKVTFGGAPTPVPAAESNKELILKSKNQQQKIKENPTDPKLNKLKSILNEK
jgi:hypothetical protein